MVYGDGDGSMRCDECVSNLVVRKSRDGREIFREYSRWGKDKDWDKARPDGHKASG